MSNLPGFTAEASLYKSARCYVMENGATMSDSSESFTFLISVITFNLFD